MLLDGENSMSDIAANADLPLTTVQREVDRLAVAGVLRTEKRGNTRLVRVNDEYPLRAALTQIVAATYGPQHVIVEEFSGLAGAEHMAIFGSWAARSAGEAGAFPEDVDLLVVGDVSKMDVYERAGRASERVGRDVSPTIISGKRWRDAADGFVQQLRARPMLDILRSDDESES